MDEAELLTFNYEKRPSEGDLERIGKFLTDKLESYLQQEIACFSEHFVIGEALVLNIRNKDAWPGPFKLQWDGVLLYDITETEPSIDAELFLFSHGERIGTLQSQGDAYIVLNYQVNDGQGQWGFSSWLPDGDGEWKYILKPREELYNTFERTYG